MSSNLASANPLLSQCKQHPGPGASGRNTTFLMAQVKRYKRETIEINILEK